MLVVFALAGAALACARSEVPLNPAEVAVFTPLAITPGETQVAAATPEASPTAPEPTPTQAPTNTSEPTATETPAVPPTITPTGVAVFPTPTPTPTLTPSPTTPPTNTPPPSATPSPAPSATQAAASATPTQITGASATQRPAATNPPAASATSGAAPTSAPVQGIPGDATFSQRLIITSEGGTLVGRPDWMIDGRTDTWASLRNGPASWTLDLGSPQTLVGVRFWPTSRDAGEPTSLRSIEISANGSTWTTVYAGSGECNGTPGCDFIPQNQFLDLGIAATRAQFVRFNGGPTRFAFAEMQVALRP